MAALLSLLLIGIGALLALAGLLMIAPQVRVHQIRVYSRGSWLFRAGMILTALGVLASLSGASPETGASGRAVDRRRGRAGRSHYGGA